MKQKTCDRNKNQQHIEQDNWQLRLRSTHNNKKDKKKLTSATATEHETKKRRQTMPNDKVERESTLVEA